MRRRSLSRERCVSPSTRGKLAGVTARDSFADGLPFGRAGSFGAGTYTLFDTAAPIAGSLDLLNTSGFVLGLPATLAFADGGNDLVLNVVPEPSSLALLSLGAGLHDIGKIGIPDRVLHKPGRFAEDELETMRRHPLIGERIVRAIADQRADRLAEIVRHHHENFDGTGYPDGLRGTAIPLFARIVSLTDNYDAMAAPRPYHPGRTHHEIIDLMSGPDAEKFDPDLLHAFRHVIEHSPMRAA